VGRTSEFGPVTVEGREWEAEDGRASELGPAAAGRGRVAEAGRAASMVALLWDNTGAPLDGATVAAATGSLKVGKSVMAAGISTPLGVNNAVAAAVAAAAGVVKMEGAGRAGRTDPGAAVAGRTRGAADLGANTLRSVARAAGSGFFTLACIKREATWTTACKRQK